MPEIAENGNTVPATISVDNPMTPQNYVKSVHVVADDNPNPDVMSVYFTPACGKAEVSTRMRLAKTQNVIAYAELSDGSVWSARAKPRSQSAAAAAEEQEKYHVHRTHPHARHRQEGRSLRNKTLVTMSWRPGQRRDAAGKVSRARSSTSSPAAITARGGPDGPGVRRSPRTPSLLSSSPPRIRHARFRVDRR